MKIALYSDIHSEFHRPNFWFSEIGRDTDIVILAGDIGTHLTFTNYISQIGTKIISDKQTLDDRAITKQFGSKALKGSVKQKN